ncbi:MAG: hypothetical protein LBJ08_03700 [Bifidobacteriaceae bacterium]|jgi:hypothetical protein|nr:hypothetical protein [Bifidobacteriaceae bacterium]
METFRTVESQTLDAVEYALWPHYPALSTENMLWGPRHDLINQLVKSVLATYSENGGGMVDHAVFLARIALDCVRLLHKGACPKTRDLDVCQAEIKPVADLLDAFALVYCDSHFDTPLDERARDALLSSGKTREQRESQLATSLHGRLRQRAERQLLTLTPGKPIVQLNAPITGVGLAQYKRNRETLRQVQRDPLLDGYEVEDTSDYAGPTFVRSTDEYLVRASVLRSSVQVIIVSGGTQGTGMTRQTATMVGIPTLRLSRQTAGQQIIPLATAARYQGELEGGTAAVFHTDEEAAALVHAFLESHRTAIFDRHARLVQLELSGPPPEAYALLTTDPVLFGNATVSFDQAMFWVDPVHWGQASSLVKAEITRRTIGGMPEAKPGGPDSVIGHRASPNKTLRSFHAFCALENLDDAARDALWQAFVQRRQYPAMVSQKGDETSVFEIKDWAQLYRSMGLGNMP